jgi:hypothetical protein
MDQDSNQPQPNSGSQSPSGQPMYPHPNVYGPPADASQYPQYGPMGGPQYPQYGPPVGGPQPQYGPPMGGPQPQYGPPMGGPQYPPYLYPGYTLEQPAKKSSKVWLWVLLGVIGSALVICIIASVFFAAALGPVVNSSVQSQSATATAAATQGGDDVIHSVDIRIVPIGQAVTIQNVVCTATLQKYTTGDSTATPKSGDEFAVLHIKLVNHSKQTQQYDPVNFYITNSTGKATLNSTLVPKAYAKQLSSGSIAPGQSVEGNLVFEIVSNEHGQALNWEPNFNVSPSDSILGKWTLGS